MKELLNLEGYGITLILHSDLTYELVTYTNSPRPWDEEHYLHHTRQEAVEAIVQNLLDSNRIYDPDSLPDDLSWLYACITHPMERKVAYSALFYVLDDIAATNEFAYRKEIQNG